jgi:hypothetical protein
MFYVAQGFAFGLAFGAGAGRKTLQNQAKALG